MKNFATQGTSLVPAINFDFDKGILDVSGRCVPENSREFFKPLFDALEKYSSIPQPQTNVSIKLEYFNTSSSKELLDVFRVLSRLKDKGKKVTIFWRYDEEDEEMREAGVEYEVITGLEFKLIEEKQ